MREYLRRRTGGPLLRRRTASPRPGAANRTAGSASVRGLQWIVDFRVSFTSIGLATVVPTLSDASKVAVVGGAVVGGGLTVIANAPNPAGQARLNRNFGGAISPIGLLVAAAIPTAISALVFRLL